MDEMEVIAGYFQDCAQFIQDNVSCICTHDKLSCIDLIYSLQMRHRLPEMFQDLTVYCDMQPFGKECPSRPFSGLVLNFCVSTRGHRDFIDHRICVVIPYGNWTGGDICLYELGLVIALNPGDILIFKSCDITHFNLHFEGQRGSIVLHSDRAGQKWVQTKNGWGNHIS